MIKYIAIKLTDDTVRGYQSLDEALNHSKIINQQDDEAPSFKFYKLNKKRKATYLGKLLRIFGTNEFYLDVDL